MSSEQELNPHVVIIANDLERFAEFAALLEKKGFPCRTLRAFPDETARAGTVYFLSFNLQSTPAIPLGKKIEQLGMACIVFAEEVGVQTAAKLSSAKMSQTLQHPYTEKNFVMAVQTIVKNRKAAFEKDERKRQYDERLRANQKNSKLMTDAGLIIQEAPEQITDDSARVFKNDASKSFFAIQQGPSGPGQRAPAFDLETPAKKEHDFNVLSYADMKKKRAAAGAFEDSPVSGESKSQSPDYDQDTVADIIDLAGQTVIPGESNLNPPAFERPMSHFWFVLALCSIASAFCLYCVYQILFT